MAFDVPVISVAFADEFGPDRPLYTLAHDLIFTGRGQTDLRQGRLPPGAPQERRRRSPGGCGDHRVPPAANGRRSVRPASPRRSTSTDAPATSAPPSRRASRSSPIVTIGGQETQLFLNRGDSLAKLLGLQKLLRVDSAPFAFGFPFGLTAHFPPNVPLPSKLVTQVLDPIDITAEFGTDPDHAEVDQMIRKHMQHALDGLARERRFPVLG